MQANNFFVGFSPNSSLSRQREKFVTFTACVTKLILAAKAAFIRKILCFEVVKILFGQLADRMRDNKTLQKREAPHPLPHSRVPLAHIFGLTGQEWSLTC